MSGEREGPDGLLVDGRGLVVDDRDNGPFEHVDARTARGKLLRSARTRRACVLRSYGLLVDEIGWIIGVSPATASAYCWGVKPKTEMTAVFGALVELYAAGKAWWAWYEDGQPGFIAAPEPASPSTSSPAVLVARQGKDKQQ